MKLKPAETKASSSSNDRSSSMVQPKTLPPKHSGYTLRPERPSSRNCIDEGLRVNVEKGTSNRFKRAKRLVHVPPTSSRRPAGLSRRSRLGWHGTTEHEE